MTFSSPPRAWRKWPAWARETPGGNLLLLRAFLGVTYVFAGLQKLANPAFFRSSNPTGIQAQMKSAESFSPIRGLLGPAVHVAVVIGVLIAVAELAIGLATLAGLRGRTAAAGGMVLSLMFFLTVSWNTSPYYYGADIVFLFAWTPLLLGGPGSFSLEAWLDSRHAAEVGAAPPRATAAIDRRAAVRKMSLTAGLGAVAVALGGVVAGVGNMLSGSGSGPTQAGGPSLGGGSGSTTNPPAGGGPTTTAAGNTPKGRNIGAATHVPVGGAATFTDKGLPAYIVRPKQAEFLGFSGVCTHEGCTVNFAQSAQQFQCPCHGSIYSALTGDVISGPAPRPLPKIGVVESSGQLYVTE